MHPNDSVLPAGAGFHPRAIDRFPELAQLATELLRKPPALLGLSETDARCVASHMQLLDYPKGATLLGEMALLDGEPRSTECTALSPVQCAGLSRQGLDQLLAQQPQVAAKLLAEVDSIVANRLRARSDQLRLYGQLTASMQRESDRLKAAAR